MSFKTNLRPLRDHEVRGTLATELIEVADDVRQFYTDFGLRPYTVRLVWIAWTADEDADGMLQEEELDLESLEPDPLIFDPSTLQPVLLAEVGVGRPILLREIELTPTPRISDLTGIGKDMDAVGLTERGGITVDQISGRISEDVLMGLLPEFRVPGSVDALKDGLEFFWETSENTPAGFVTPGFEGQERPSDQRPPRRRFHVSGTPHYDAGAFQWTVTLVRADGERGRDGEIEPVDSAPGAE